jgi:cyclophilin family peptidyl-prolyl cis-trans isomerase
VRAIAAFATGLLELDLEPATEQATRRRISERLADLLDDGEPLVVAQALWSLGALADQSSAPAVSAVLADASRPVAVHRAALDAWWRLPGSSPQPVVSHLQATDVEVRRAAARALRRLDDPNALPALETALGDADGRVRAEAIRGMHAAPPVSVERHLLSLLDDDDWHVVCAALGWATALWRDDAEVDDRVFTAVLTASARRNRHVQRLAFEALVAAPGKFSVAQDRLLVALQTGDASTRTAVMEAIGASDNRSGNLLDEILQIQGLGAPPREGSAAEIPEDLAAAPLEAAALVNVLGAAGGNKGGAWLRLLTAHGPLAARAAGLRQLGRVAPEEANAIARAWLGDGPPVLRAVAAEVVAELAAAGDLDRSDDVDGWSELLWTAQREMGAVGALEPRLILLQTLLSLDAPLLQPRAAALLPDDDRVIRTWAVRNLDPPRRRTREMLAGAIAPLQTGRTADDYRRLAQRLLTLQQEPPRVEIETARGTLTWQLQVAWTPLTAAAYLEWIEAGFFDDLVFHRVVPDFVVQDGDPTAVGYGGAPGSLRSEETPIAYRAGTVGLALAGRDTGGSQFFITHSPQPHLTGRYPVLGRVIDNGRVVDRIQPGDRLRMRSR